MPTALLDGGGYSIALSRLLDLVAERAIEVGADVRFEQTIRSRDELGTVELVDASDSVRRPIRTEHGGFGTALRVMSKK